MASLPQPIVTLEDYFALEESSDVRHEYLDGEVFEIEGASLRHSSIQFQTASAIAPAVLEKGCQVHLNTVRVGARRKGLFTYPDILVVCNPILLEGAPDTLTNPTVVIEVLSPSTEDYDRGKKFHHYASIPSLREYITINQDKPLIEHRIRQSEGKWLLTVIEGMDSVLRVATIPAEIPFSVIYARVKFDDGGAR